MKQSEKEFIINYFNDIKRCLNAMQSTSYLQILSEIKEVILKAREMGKTLFIVGNGGSASTASHFAADLAKGTIVKGAKRIKAVALTDNIPQITAWANDKSYEDIFVEQLENLLEEGDVVVGFSCRGNSLNVIKALEYANGNGAISIGFTGFDGGKLKDVSKISLIVPSQNMQRCEDVHLLLAHMLSLMIKEEIKEELR